jgi:hypothetical protein
MASETNEFPGESVVADQFPKKKGTSKQVYSQSVQSGIELYQLIYKHNKSFELHANREVIRFENGNVVFPEKYVEGFPAEIIKSEEFKLQSDNFVVKKIGE